MILVIDTETTGVDPKSDSIVEVAGVPVSTDGVIRRGRRTFVAAGRRIPPQAKAVHHIKEEDLREAPHLAHALAIVHQPESSVLPPDFPMAYAAHNAAFDRDFIPPTLIYDRPWLCTWRCALHLYPNAPGHGNQVLRYAVPGLSAGVEAELSRYDPAELGVAHRALYDSVVTAVLLRALLKLRPLSELLELQAKPVLLRTVKFGKHRGALWSDVPKDYLRWMLRQSGADAFDGDARYTADYYSR